MRAAFRLLLMTCLLWCALGVAEPVQAHGNAGGQGATIDAPLLDGSSDDPAGMADTGGQAHHHHCPVAPDVPLARLIDHAPAPRGPLFGAPVATLGSLTRAPPLQPPATA